MITSSTIGTEDVTIPAIVFVFELATGNIGTKTVIEPFLNTEARASQRARREFLDNGYTSKRVRLVTYRTDLNLNDIINVHGLKYKITTMKISSNQKKMTTTVEGLRYE